MKILESELAGFEFENLKFANFELATFKLATQSLFAFKFAFRAFLGFVSLPYAQQELNTKILGYTP